MSQREIRRRRRVRNQMITYIVSAVLLIGIVAGLFFGGKQALAYFTPALEPVEEVVQEEPAVVETPVVEEPVEEEVVPEADLLDELIDSYLAEMTLEQKVAGLFIVTPESITDVTTAVKAGEGTKAALEQYPVGGMIYSTKNILSEDQIKEMLENTSMYCQFPMFLAVDEEGGSVARVASSTLNVAKVESMGSVGATLDTANAATAGTTIGEYLSYYGFNVDFAPVADVLTNPDSAIGDRSFGADPVMTASMVGAFVESIQNTQVSACLKHFPGLGNADGDSHELLITTDKTLEELRATEFLPFISGIQAGADFVMMGHISVPAVIGDNTPASLSKIMVTDVLRTELGFDGIIVTDAMNMGAITEAYEPQVAAVMALNAGVDMILMPEDFLAAYQGVLDAVADGTLTKERIDEALHRIYRVKYKDSLE
ncbi:MAG: beta-N-acetylhexosaminidase [Clostridiales bacterium]|nr:beta-N-acetylhexosaminidase [Clostridiales bacterium]